MDDIAKAIRTQRGDRMDDLISRKAAIDALAEHEKSNGHNYTLFVDIVSECAEIIRDLPPAQPQDVEKDIRVMCGECDAWNVYKNYPNSTDRKCGKWIEVNDNYNRIRGICSVCGWESHMYDDDVVGMNFCPNCGVKMEIKKEEATG